ncbi:hypothetical protein ACFQ21_13190 [Ohtaekwangia kribbensis]|uniref:Uncharacterized protein n=1 Tax=Ohtaekwangia kribbensis TaxID=688913 RepID=A0ABW3K498_9BACT
MGKGIRTELLWLLGVVILAQLVWYSILGQLLFNGRLLEIQDHDAFIIVPKLFLVGLTSLVLLLFMYVLRWIHSKAINRTVIIFAVVVLTIVWIFLFLDWLIGLQNIRDLGKSWHTEINGADRVPMTLLSHASLTFAVGIVALFDMIIGYKLIAKKK